MLPPESELGGLDWTHLGLMGPSFHMSLMKGGKVKRIRSGKCGQNVTFAQVDLLISMRSSITTMERNPDAETLRLYRAAGV